MSKYVILICDECLSRNYRVKKNINSANRLELKKFCHKCNKHNTHKETR
ncbi:MAG: 50S ribosomal protein L33 [Malacoplasma sp.]